ncbi:ABC transporter permease [Ekhidna sp. MALMAid0563]|uniref:ABC transporter permease n=1 Tax=Ekhidna sp. MALMAid0563 TaxID=3143937 RepID=UPI0032DE7360
MFTSFKLFFRSLKRNKLFSSINILGLTVGFFASVLIFLYVQNELSYDTFHEKGDRIYRVNQTFIWGEDNDRLFGSTGPGVGYAISEEIPEVQQVVRVHTPELMPVRFKVGDEERFFNNEYVLAADSNFFEVFTYPLVHGDPFTALDKPNAVVLSTEVAKKFFGNNDPMGQLIDLGGGPNRKSYVVTGVVAEMDQPSYIDFDMLISMNSIDRVARSNWSWIWTMFETFVVARPDVNRQALQAKMNFLPEKYTYETLEMMGYNWKSYHEAGKEWKLYLQPFKDIYLHSDNIYNRIGDTGSYVIVASLVGSAIFLIILSCINFINLSTAQFTTRAKDVALRKVLGGSKMAFIKRFFGESLAYCTISLILSLGVLFYSLPFINQAVGTNLDFGSTPLTSLFIFLICLIFLVSVIAGFYPFMFFNAFKPMQAMKGELKTGSKGIQIRNGMLVTQYVLSFLLIICTTTIYKQLNYFLSKDIGFNKENLVTISNTHWTGAPEAFSHKIASLEGVIGASVCDASPINVYNGDQFIPDEPEAGSIPLNYTLADEHYLELAEIDLLVGRNFDPSFASDTSAIIINATAAEAIGWSIDETILHKKIGNSSGKYHVIGVISDFNYWTLHAPIQPFALFHKNSRASYGRPLTNVLVRVKSSSENLAAMSNDFAEIWSEFAPGRPYDQEVLNEVFASRYQTEQRFGNVLSFFTILTVIIASLGLFGIVVFTIEQKFKEIGIRKVLGASLTHIIVLFSKKYVKLLLIGFAVAVPAGYYLMSLWLADFEYSITLSVDIFLISLGLLLVISLAISVFHTTKASLMNPAEVLKDE